VDQVLVDLMRRIAGTHCSQRGGADQIAPLSPGAGKLIGLATGRITLSMPGPAMLFRTL
jgi:hypothetical protein